MICSKNARQQTLLLPPGTDLVKLELPYISPTLAGREREWVINVYVDNRASVMTHKLVQRCIILPDS